MALKEYIAFHNETTRRLRETGSLGDTPCIIAAIQDMDAAPNADDLTSIKVGGFGDRLKGIINALLIAIATKRYLLIHWPVPLPLTEDYSPAAMDWRIAPSYTIDPEKRVVVDLVDDAYPPQKEIFASGDIESDLFQNKQIAVVYGNAIRLEIANNPRYRPLLDKAFPGLTWDDIAPRTLFYKGTKALFKYTPTRPDIIETYKTYIDKFKTKPYRLGIQYRTGGDGAWEDPKVESLDNYHRIIRIAIKMLQLRMPDDYLIYMATDSDAVKKRIIDDYGSKLNFVWLEQPVVHIHRSGAGGVAGSSFVYLEHNLLGLCDDLVIGWGGFGLTAAWMKNKTPFIYMSKEVETTLDELIQQKNSL